MNICINYYYRTGKSSLQVKTRKDVGNNIYVGPLQSQQNCLQWSKHSVFHYMWAHFHVFHKSVQGDTHTEHQILYIGVIFELKMQFLYWTAIMHPPADWKIRPAFHWVFCLRVQVELGQGHTLPIVWLATIVKWAQHLFFWRWFSELQLFIGCGCLSLSLSQSETQTQTQ